MGLNFADFDHSEKNKKKRICFVIIREINLQEKSEENV